MSRVQVITGDCIGVLPTLPAGCVHCSVTSPPYWGLRDYGVDGQLGLEKTPEEYVAKMVAVFREVWRVLRDDGTLWLNLGDSYHSPRPNGGVGAKSTINSTRTQEAYRIGQRAKRGQHCSDVSGAPNRAALHGLKPKDLCGIPWMVAFALRADGWYLRSDIIWSKPNPMPESVTDRPTKAHEYLFLLSKQERYYYDQSAILEDCSPNTHARLAQNVAAQIGSERANGGAKTNGNMKAVARGVNPKAAISSPGSKQNASFAEAVCLPVTRRNKRSVWEIPTYSFKGAHFATFPPALIEPCILAGCPTGGVVLDPFGGSGTVGEVCSRFGRDGILIELNPKYADMARRRFADAPLQLVGL